MKRTMVAVAAVMAAGVVAGLTATAGECQGTNAPAAPVAVEKAGKAPIETKPMTLAGTIAKTESVNKKTGQTVAVYELADKDGVKYRLHQPRAGKKAGPAIQLTDCVGVPVEVKCEVAEKQDRKGAKKLVVVKILEITKLPQPAAPAQ
jgi:hypothetical protein